VIQRNHSLAAATAVENQNGPLEDVTGTSG